MDWGIVYQLTFFLALGLLAIVVTIFVFAVSQVGRATEAASKEQQDILLGQKEAKEQQIENIQKQLEEDKKAGHLDEAKLLAELQSTKDKITGYDAQLKHLQERIILIRRRGAVVCPGAFFLAAIVLTLIASGLAEGQNLVAFPFWIISIGALIFGSFRVFRTLGAIEEVTITSREAMEKFPEAVKAAIKALEEEKRPELVLYFQDEEPPFNLESGEQKKIEFAFRLEQGDIARKSIAMFFAPSDFEFPDMTTWLQPKYKDTVGGYLTTKIDLGDIRMGIDLPEDIDIKAPSSLGKFTLYYKLTSEGFTSGYGEFEVIVEKSKKASK
jgi:hypothetical protein